MAAFDLGFKKLPQMKRSLRDAHNGKDLMMMNELDQSPGVEFLELFAVPFAIVSDAAPAPLNGELMEWILAERGRDPGIQRSNAGGWHSKPDLPVRGVGALDQLFQAIIEQVRSMHERVSTAGKATEYRARFMMQAWATVMENGDFVRIHDHADAHWSAVYYVDAGQDDEIDGGGRIAWINPIGPHLALPGASLAPTTFELIPRTGTLVVFPGWLRHMVQPYRGIRPRIAIAANIEVQVPRLTNEKKREKSKTAA